MDQLNKMKSVSAHTANALTNLSEAVGVNNYAENSVARVLIEGVSSVTASMYDSVKTVIDNTSLATAYGQYLDAYGASYGVFRNRIPFIRIAATSGVATILIPANNSTLIKINAGTKVEIGNGIRATVIDTVEAYPGDKSINVSVAIESSDNGGLYIQSGASIPLDSSRDSSLLGLQLQFTRPVSLMASVEDDTVFRQRIYQARNSAKAASEDALHMMISSIPGVNGYRISKGIRGPGTVDINIMSNTMIDGADDSVIDQAMDIIAQRLDSYGAAGIDYKIGKPTGIKLYVDFTNESSDLSDSLIKNLIYRACVLTYNYSGSNSITDAGIYNNLNSVISDISDIDILRIYAYDEELDEYIYFDLDASLPEWMHFIIYEENIRRVQ